MNEEVQTLMRDLRMFLAARFPSVLWHVAHERQEQALEPLVHITAQRHPFLPGEIPVQCTFGLWESMNPMTGGIRQEVWSSWGGTAVQQLRTQKPDPSRNPFSFCF